MLPQMSLPYFPTLFRPAWNYKMAFSYNLHNNVLAHSSMFSVPWIQERRWQFSRSVPLLKLSGRLGAGRIWKVETLLWWPPAPIPPLYPSGPGLWLAWAARTPPRQAVLHLQSHGKNYNLWTTPIWCWRFSKGSLSPGKAFTTFRASTHSQY